jgi:hypothetical protein
MGYSDQFEYLKFLKSKCQEEDDCGGGCHECKETDDCGCCPPGLVSVFNKSGKHVGCLTPNDAEIYQENISKLCQSGYVALYNYTTGAFLGCVTEAEFPALNTSVNGTIGIIMPTSIDISPITETFPVNNSLNLYAVFTPTNTTNQQVTWSTTNAGIATVSASGVVNGISLGTVTIRATSVANNAVYLDRTITIT